jgi:hypothetical protein
MELNQYLELARDAELHAKTARSPDDAQAWLEIAEAWKRVALTQAERGGIAPDIKPAKGCITGPARAA